jgi:hypothetical protein
LLKILRFLLRQADRSDYHFQIIDAMTLLAVGINYTTAPLAVRERLAYPTEILQPSLQDLLKVKGISEAAILSTCNRTELYCTSSTANQQILVDWVAQNRNIDPADFTPYLYSHIDSQLIRHMFRVACGLDSMILGEPQILGQMKSAYQAASQAGTLGKRLGKLFQYTFMAAKKHRYRHRFQPGFGRLCRRPTGAADFRQAERTNRAPDRRRRNDRINGTAPCPARHRAHRHRQPHL